MWVVACVEHARAAARDQVVKIKDGIVNLQAFIMIRRAGEPGFAPSVLASLGMIEESGGGAPSLIDGATSVHEFCSRRWWQLNRHSDVRCRSEADYRIMPRLSAALLAA